MKQVKQPKTPIIVYAIIVFVFMLLLNILIVPMLFEHQIQDVDYSTFLDMTTNKKIATVQMNSDYIYFTDTKKHQCLAWCCSVC